MAGLFQNFMPSVRNNSTALTQAGIGLLTGQTPPQQAALGAAGFAGARQQAMQKNQTLAYLQKVNPQLAQAFEQGLIGGKEVGQYLLEAQKPQKPEYKVVGNSIFNTADQSWMENPNDTPSPMSTVGKINADYKAGLMDQATYEAAIKKAAQSEGLEIVSDGAGGFTVRQGVGVGSGSSNQQVKNDANTITAAREIAASGSQLKQTASMLREANKNVGYSGPIGGKTYDAIDSTLEQISGGRVGLPGSPGARAQMKSGGLDVALQQVAKTKGAISNAEMNLFMSASPGLQNTPQGNAVLIEMIDAIADRQVMRATEMENWYAQNKTLNGFEAAWNQYISQNPLIVDNGSGSISLSGQGGGLSAPPQDGVVSYQDYFGAP